MINIITYIKRKSIEDDELCHWKYIRRERVNGKWRYYYDEKNNGSITDNIKDKLGYDEESAYNTMKNTVEMHKGMLSKYNKEISNIRKGSNGWKDYPYKDSMTKKIRELVIWESGAYRSAMSVCDTALKKYKKTPLYKIRQIESMISNGMDKVKKLFL